LIECGEWKRGGVCVKDLRGGRRLQVEAMRVSERERGVFV
jgi:hypothetical protein